MSSWLDVPDEEIPERIVGKSLELGADEVICSLLTGNTRQVRFANNSITASKSWDQRVASIFLTKDGKVVATDISDFSTTDEALADLLKMSDVMEKSQSYQGLAEGSFGYRSTKPDTRIPKLLDELYGYVDDAITSTLNAGAKRVAGVLYSSCGTQFLHSSTGPSGSYSSADIEISIRAMADNQGSGHMVQSVVNLDDFDPGSSGREAGELAVSARNPELGEEGKYDVLFSPMPFANILERVASSSSAGFVDAGFSFLKDKVGEEVASPAVNLTDDGTHPQSLNTPPFDNEGVPTRKTPLIVGGELMGYLHNTSTAKRFGTETTGNAGLVFPQSWSVHLHSGDMGKDELMSQIKDGYYVTNVWYTRFQNYQTGDFSTIPRDAIFRIKDGQVMGSAKDIRISENMLALLQKVKAVGNDVKQVHWWEVNTPVFTPHVLVEGVNITKSTQ
jgi:PmbA protein